METTLPTSPKTQKTIDALWKLQKIILDTLDFNEVVQKTVNSILSELGYLNLGYRILVLTLVDPTNTVLKRIALSQTQEAYGALNASPIPFEQIDIPLSADDNLLIKALKEQKPYTTNSWPDIFKPVLTDEEARKNQNASGIKTSMIYPLIVKGKSIGVMIFSMVKNENEVTDEERDLIERFTDIVGLAVQNAQLYTQTEEVSKKLRLANEQLKSIDKLKDEFVSLASHELRTPMTAISSYIWMVKDDPNITPQQKVYLQNTYASTQRLIRLVNDMLNVSRIESGRLIIKQKPVNIEALVQETITEILPKAVEQNIKLVVEAYQTQLPNVFADSDKIKEVIMNLLGNSLKFTPSGGKITISFSENNDLVEVHIADTGRGIKKEDMPRLFQKFGMIEGNYLKTTPGQGSGLGLYISKSIVLLHGGSMWFASDGENRGTTFSFSLKKA